MTKERELLKQAVDMLGFWLEEHEHRSVKEFMEEIRAHLASEEGKKEELEVNNWVFEARELYSSPQSEQRTPLSREEIEAEYISYREVDPICWPSFLQGVKWAEKMHKIGEDNV